MQNTPEDKANCPLAFSYTGFGNGYSVHSDFGETIEDRVFIGSAGVKKLQNLCEGEDRCDQSTCAYQKELVRALSATSSPFDSKTSVKKT